MWKVTTQKFEKPKEGDAYISDITRIVPERHVHPKPVFIDLSKVDKNTAARIRKVMKRSKLKVVKKSNVGKPVDFGITESEFYSILDKVSQPTKNNKQEPKQEGV